MEIRSLHDLAGAVAKNPTLKSEIQADPVGALNGIAQNGGLPNTGVYKLVVGALGLTVLLAIVGAILLALRAPAGSNVETPAVITALGSAAVGALAGLLAPPPR